MFKSEIRKKILKIRKIKKKNNTKIQLNNIYNFIKKKVNLDNKTIGGYYPVNCEIDDLNILSMFEKKKIKIALPLIKKNFKLRFVKCSLKDPFLINQYGIPEPENKKEVYPDVLLVPLVAFDKKLNRLGYGGGYYDRFIKYLRKKKNILTIGLAFDFQEFVSIPTTKFDQKLDHIITNKYIL